MEPRIQYAKTSDGVSIAYAVFGDGPPVVFASNIWGDVHLIQSGLPQLKETVERLVAQGRRVIAYDGRGMGSSDRSATDFSPEARVRDLEAVLERLGLEGFALFGRDHGAPTAVAYAVEHQQRVSHLILIEAYISGADFYGTVPVLRAVKAMREMAEEQWELFTLTLGSLITGFTDVEHARKSAETFRLGMSAEALLSLVDASERIDIGSLLSSIKVPTLVVHNTSFVVGSLDISRALASRIPEAEFVTTDDPARAIDDFLGAVEEAVASTAKPSTAGSLRTILFTDLASSTALTQRLGDAKAQELVRAHNAIVREALRAHAGSEIKHTGDGIMASFPTASGALECAVAIQRGVADRGEPNLQVHIGLNAGEPVAEEADLFGTAVQLARRICDHATAGQILVSNVVRELAAGKGFLFADSAKSYRRASRTRYDSTSCAGSRRLRPGRKLPLAVLA